MPLIDEVVPVSSKARWTGIVLSGIPAVLLALSATMKFAKLASVLQGFAQMGFPERLIPIIGALELGCVIVYLIPRTAVLGAILMTGYLGGAIVTSLRVGDPSWFGPLLLGVFAWAGLYFRLPLLRRMIPVRS